MTDEVLKSRLLAYFHLLSKSEKLNVLAYLKSLRKENNSRAKTLAQLSGSISSKDAKLMEDAIAQW